MKINTIIVHLSARFLKLYVESSSFWIGQRETVDRIRCYSQIYFAICMGHAWNWVHWNRCLKTFPSMCDSPHLRAGCTLKHGSGSLMDPMSTQTAAVHDGARASPGSGTSRSDSSCVIWNFLSEISARLKVYGHRKQRSHRLQKPPSVIKSTFPSLFCASEPGFVRFRKLAVQLLPY